VRGAPYEEFTTALALANRALPGLHAAARWEGPPEPGVALAIPRATAGAADGEGPLDDWDLAATRLHFPRSAPGLDVPFADVHLAWTEESLLVAVIGQDFFDLDLYERSSVLPSDTLALHLITSGISAAGGFAAGAGGSRHVTIRFEPVRLEQPPDFPPSEHRVEVYSPRGYVVPAGGGDGVLQPEIRARRLRAIAPRFDAVIAIPRALLGLEGTLPDAKIELEVALVGFLRGRAFTLSGRPIERALTELPRVRATLSTVNGEAKAAAPPATLSAPPAETKTPGADPAPSPRPEAPAASAP